MSQKKNPLQSYKISTGEIVLGREINSGEVIYAKGETPYQAEIFIDSNAKPSTAVPFSLEQRIAGKIPGIKNFPEDHETVFAKLNDYSNTTGLVQIYSLFRKDKEQLHISQLLFLDGDLELLRKREKFFSIYEELSTGNYFFQSQIFIKGNAAIYEFEKISNSNNIKNHN